MPTHWLATMAARAGLVAPELLKLDSGLAIEEAWERTAKGCGVSQGDLAAAVAGVLKLGVANLTAVEPNIIRLVPENVARRFCACPLRDRYRTLVVATCDPTNPDLEQMVRFSSGRDPVIEIAPPRDIMETINVHYSSEHTVEMVLQGMDVSGLDTVSIMEDMPVEDANAEVEASTAPVIKLANLILRDAILQRASDIHFEPGYTQGAVRFRVDGVLRRYMQMPMPALRRVVSRIKILGKMDIADRLRPQDGRTRVLVSGSIYDLRLSTVPTGESEKLVVRVLNTIKTLNLADLSMPEPEASRLRSLLEYRNSLVIVTGPTGSGKTTTLYAALKELASSEINVMTVEDPVEYDLPGITQIQIEPKQQVTFASVLRSILRQDPDVILIGEIRDLETAQIAIQASMTGHLVLATVHTKDAASVVARLSDLGLDRAAIAACLRGVLAQRLLRRICPDCAEAASDPLTPEEARLGTIYDAPPRVRAAGCSRCNYTGYLGRLPVIEVLELTPELRAAVADGAAPQEIEAHALAHGFRTMLDVALERVADGSTTPAEVMRVLGAREEGVPKEAGAPPGNVRVVVADDDPVVRTQTRGLLNRNGYQVSEAGDGGEALDLLRRDPDVSLVITDLAMPRVGGRDVLAALRANPSTAGLPVIVLTGSDDPLGEAELIEAGADDYIRKPLEPTSFMARVRATVRRAA